MSGRILRRKSSRPGSRRRPGRLPRVSAEVLEPRCLLSVTTLQPVDLVDSAGHGGHSHGEVGADHQHVPADVIPNQYIVVLKDGVNADDFAGELRGQGRQVLHVYNHALNGLAFRGQAPADDPRILRIEPDVVVRTTDHFTPTGVDRIDADLNPVANIDDSDERVDVDVAVLDTGVDATHPDLNVYQTAFFIGTSANDGHGHGSHVAGTIGAIDNNFGVVGVAPGARIWGVKVLDDAGAGSNASLIGGVDYVTAHADEIDVVNMSLSGQGSSVSLHQAIQNSVAAGVVYAVAAANNGADIYGSNFALDPTANCVLGIFCAGHEDFFPASYPEVATIAALADSDGQPGGFGSGTAYGPDDSFASFSNFSHNQLPDNPVYSPGLGIDLIMPGVDILSTWNNGEYATISGTSMATPHAAGLFGLYIAQMGRDVNGDGFLTEKDASIIRQHLIDTGIAQNSANGLNTPNDPDGHPEVLGWADLNDALFVTVGDQAITKIAENGGRTTATITRYGDISSEATIALSVSDPGSVNLSTTSVTIAAGSRTSDAFTITAIDNNEGDRDRVVTITATAGLQNGTGRVTVLDDESQWADSVIAFNSQWEPGDGSGHWQAIQAVGEPDTFSYGDIPTAYSPSTPDAGTEWITVGFNTPVFSTGVVVRETLGNGHVEQIEVREAGTNSYTTTWQGIDNSPQGQPVDFQVNWAATAFLVDAVRVTFNTSPAGWEEIDAIELLGGASPGEPDNEPPTVTLGAPNGGETLVAGQLQTIDWTANDNIGVTSIDLLYSADNGLSYSTIATGLANTGTYSWTLPDVHTTEAFVKVIAYDAGGNIAEDISDAAFSISDATAPSVTVTSPNGGEIWGEGTSHNITWNAADNIGVTSVDLAYSIDGATGTFLPIATGIANTGSYSWLIPDEPSMNVFVRVTAHDGALNSASDLSNAAFTITQPDSDPPEVTVTSPNGSESWDAGSTHDITWNATDNVGVTSIDLLYSADDGGSYTTIATGLANTVPYSWTLPAVHTTKARVKVIAHDAGGNSAEDVSNAVFTISDQTPPSVTVTSPNGGESWDVGSTHDITWNATDNIGVTSVDIAYTTNDGVSYTPIATGISNTGTYSWVIPDDPSTNVIVRVTAYDGAGNSTADDSDGAFSIEAVAGNADDMYIWEINWSEKRKGKGGAVIDLTAKIVIKTDSDADGIAEASDDGAANVAVDQFILVHDTNGKNGFEPFTFPELDGDTTWIGSGTTNGKGIITFNARDVPSGDFEGTVAALSDPGSVLFWDGALDADNPAYYTIAAAGPANGKGSALQFLGAVVPFNVPVSEAAGDDLETRAAFAGTTARSDLLADAGRTASGFFPPSFALVNDAPARDSGGSRDALPPVFAFVPLPAADRFAAAPIDDEPSTFDPWSLDLSEDAAGLVSPKRPIPPAEFHAAVDELFAEDLAAVFDR